MMHLTDRKIIPDTASESVSRFGGRIPMYFLDKSAQIDGLNFYACLQHPTDETLAVSIFIPDNPRLLLENKIYPDCPVKVFVHPHSDESGYDGHICKDLKKTCFAGYIHDDTQEGIVQAGGTPQLIQDEDYYWENLTKDGYVFFMQIDEAHYPDDLVAGSYPFYFGALYLYCRPHDHRDITAGFWQTS